MGLRMLQFINNNAVNHDTLEAVALSVALMVWVVLLVGLRSDVSEDGFYGDQEAEREEKKAVLSDNAILAHPMAAAVSLLVCVICMTCIFATLDNVVTLYHAEGTMDIGQWPRLLLAVSGLLAGFLFDLADHRYMNIMMYCVTLLSVICVLVILSGGSFLIGLIVFYLSAGFFVLFFAVGFMRLSYHMRFPELWAGLGRGANNICAGMIAAISLTVFETGNGMLISIIALVLFVLISIAMFVYARQTEVHPIPESEIKKDVLETDSQRFSRFSEAYALTPREQDVLKILLTSDESVQNLAEQLFISRAALYRHITALNEKIGTKSRIGLIQFYYSWEESSE